MVGADNYKSNARNVRINLCDLGHIFSARNVRFFTELFFFICQVYFSACREFLDNSKVSAVMSDLSDSAVMSEMSDFCGKALPSLQIAHAIPQFRIYSAFRSLWITCGLLFISCSSLRRVFGCKLSGVSATLTLVRLKKGQL